MEPQIEVTEARQDEEDPSLWHFTLTYTLPTPAKWIGLALAECPICEWVVNRTTAWARLLHDKPEV